MPERINAAMRGTPWIACMSKKMSFVITPMLKIMPTLNDVCRQIANQAASNNHATDTMAWPA